MSNQEQLGDSFQVGLLAVVVTLTCCWNLPPGEHVRNQSSPERTSRNGIVGGAGGCEVFFTKTYARWRWLQLEASFGDVWQSTEPWPGTTGWNSSARFYLT